MIAKNKKRLEITLSLEDSQLLETLASRFNISKSDCVRQALKVFASKRHHKYSIIIDESKKDYQQSKITSNEESVSIEDWDKLLDNNSES